MRLRTAILFLSVLLPLHNHLLAQNPPGYISSIAVNPPVVAVDAPNATVTVTVTPNNGLPVSSLDGMIVEIDSRGGGGLIPLKNGVASARITSSFNDMGIEITAYFPGGQPGSSPTALAEVIERYLPLATALDGDYVFSVHSYSGNGSNRAGEGVSIGALTFNEDSKGNKTVTGELDYNGPLGSFQALPVAGSYTLDGYGRGTVTLRSSAGTQHFDLFTDPEYLSAIHFNDPTGGIKEAALVETDGPVIAGSGTLTARSPGSGLSPLNGFRLDLSGQIAGQTAFPFRASLTGSVDVNLGFPIPKTASGTVNLVAGTYTQRGVPLTVNPVSSDAQNRYTFRLTTPNQPAQQPSSFVGYAVDGDHYLLMSTDPVPSTVLLSGQASRP